MHALIAAQVAFCFVVHFVAGLFVTTFDRLSNQPTGFSAERILNLETVTRSPQPPVYWDQVAERSAHCAGCRNGRADGVAADERGERVGTTFRSTARRPVRCFPTS